ncbi:hypothetical protein K474DRAFT_1738629, partial [Panus rudis PR-1116 ss-1]
FGSLYLSQGPNPNSDPDVGVEGIISDFDLSILRCKPGPCSEPEHKETSMTQVLATMAVDSNVPSPVANLQFGGWTESSRGAHTAEEASIGPGRPFTSMIQFMAIGVLEAIYPSNLRDLPPSKRGIPRTPLHSLESAIYVASYSILYKCHVHGKEVGFNKDDRKTIRDIFEQQFGQTKIDEVLAARHNLTNSGNSMVFKSSIRDRFPIIVALLDLILDDICTHYAALSRQEKVEHGGQIFRELNQRYNPPPPDSANHNSDAATSGFSHDRVLTAIDFVSGPCQIFRYSHRRLHASSLMGDDAEGEGGDGCADRRARRRVGGRDDGERQTVGVCETRFLLRESRRVVRPAAARSSPLSLRTSTRSPLDCMNNLELVRIANSRHGSFSMLAGTLRLMNECDLHRGLVMSVMSRWSWSSLVTSSDTLFLAVIWNKLRCFYTTAGLSPSCCLSNINGQLSKPHVNRVRCINGKMTDYARTVHGEALVWLVLPTLSIYTVAFEVLRTSACSIKQEWQLGPLSGRPPIRISPFGFSASPSQRGPIQYNIIIKTDEWGL